VIERVRFCWLTERKPDDSRFRNLEPLRNLVDLPVYFALEDESDEELLDFVLVNVELLCSK
jgi:hypothetical protein